MRARGAKINPSVSLYADPGAGMGLVATRALERDEALMLLPPRTQLRWAEQEADVLSAKQGELQALVAGEVPPNLWDFRLACLLLASQREGGAMRADWGVYADSLPLQVPDLPILWTGARLDAIKDKYPHCAEEATKRLVVLRAIANGLSQKGEATVRLFGGPVESRDLATAYCYVSSRAVRVSGGLMAPLLDLANHSADPNCAIATGSGGVVAVVAQKKVEAGTPVTISYGPASDAQLLLDYGFTLPEGTNPFGAN